MELKLKSVYLFLVEQDGKFFCYDMEMRYERGDAISKRRVRTDNVGTLIREFGNVVTVEALRRSRHGTNQEKRKK